MAFLLPIATSLRYRAEMFICTCDPEILNKRPLFLHVTYSHCDNGDILVHATVNDGTDLSTLTPTTWEQIKTELPQADRLETLINAGESGILHWSNDPANPSNQWACA